MEPDELKIQLIMTLLCLLPFLIFGIVVAIRARSFQAGAKVFLLIAIPAVALMMFVIYFDNYLPENTQNQIGQIVVSFSILVIGVFAIMYRINKFKTGNLMPNGRTPAGSTAIIITILLCCIMLAQVPLSIRTINGISHLDIDYKSAIIFWPIAALMMLRVYYSFEYRQKGFIFRGKPILLSSIKHAEWENLMDKTKLRVWLKNTDKTISIKTPWELITSLDDYIKTNFSRP